MLKALSHLAAGFPAGVAMFIYKGIYFGLKYTPIPDNVLTIITVVVMSLIILWAVLLVRASVVRERISDQWRATNNENSDHKKQYHTTRG